LTAKLDEDSIEMAYDIGGVDYISKPFKPKELLARVKNHLELREYQLYLSQRVNEEIEKNRIQEVVLYQKSKQSALGELLMHIAHQWKQPLAEISAIQTFFEAKVRLNQSNKAFILENIGKTNDILEFMSTTLLTFQDFYKPSIDMEYFDIKDLIEHTIKILSATLKFYRIELTLNLQNHLSFYGVKNEVSQVILNILNNSKNILIQRDIKNGKIKVILLKNTKHLSIVIEDNGGGIKSDFLENLFKPFISENSSGVGLYISKSIIDRYNGEIKAENINDGARFTINLPII
jgi:signal transduction histidine kinase